MSRFAPRISGKSAAVKRVISGRWLLGRPVLLGVIRLARPTDLLLDLAAMRVVGLELRCGDGSDRFLPFSVARIEDTEILLESALQLVDERGLAFYRRTGTSLTALRGRSVERRGQPLGVLEDVRLDAAGSILELVVTADGDRRRIELDPGVSIDGRSIASAA